MKELDDLAAAFVATIDVRQNSADRIKALTDEFLRAFNANEPAKAGPVAEKLASVATAYAALAVKDVETKAIADAEAAQLAEAVTP